jgi:hypothetical protein
MHSVRATAEYMHSVRATAEYMHGVGAMAEYMHSVRAMAEYMHGVGAMAEYMHAYLQVLDSNICQRNAFGAAMILVILGSIRRTATVGFPLQFCLKLSRLVRSEFRNTHYLYTVRHGDTLVGPGNPLKMVSAIRKS